MDGTATNPLSDRPENPLSDTRQKATNHILRQILLVHRIEERSLLPYIVVYYELMFPSEMDHFKQFASGKEYMY